MLSTRLIQMIEDHAEELTRGLIQQLKSHPHTASFQKLSDMEIHRRVFRVYRNLGAWLVGTSRDDVRRAYEELGHERFREGVPLREVIYALILNKKNLLTYVKNHGLGGSTVEIFAEQELVNKVDQFYDDAMYFTTAGYEEAVLGAAQTLATAS